MDRYCIFIAIFQLLLIEYKSITETDWIINVIHLN